MTEQLIPGLTITIGHRKLVVPPLNLARVKRLKDELAILTDKQLASGDNSGFQHMEASVTIIHTALTRNYPDLTREEVEDLVDMGNIAPVLSAVLGQSGFVQGEQRPVMEPPSTGTESTPT